MSSKPVVSLAVGPETYKRMFRIEDLDRLHLVATVRGPVPAGAGVDDYRHILEPADAVITGWGTIRLSPAMLANANRLKLIAHSAGTVKSLVDEWVFDHGIRITTAASANAVSVAQYTVAMMVSLLKQIPWIAQAYARGDQEETRRRRQLIRELMDMDVGIIGASRVGREVIAILRSYPRLTVKCFDPYLTPEQAAQLGVQPATMQEVCRCQVVSIHAPDTPETHRMLGPRALALLPDHAVLINTSRGALVDEDALHTELKKRPLYVCLDVTDPEPPRADSPLRTAANVILTPHVAGALQQACKDMGELAISETLRFFAGQPLQHEVTRDMLPTQA
ncbi:MAG: hydroxyacid dehydrogenase [Burkholderiales bacterium]|nr:hydroxyacid dehydrogenase [Phycisphaerae bacterium]